VLEAAIRTAIGRRGVAVVVIPGDVAIQKYEAPFSAPVAPAIRQPVVVQLDPLADLLNRAPP